MPFKCCCPAETRCISFEESCLAALFIYSASAGVNSISIPPIAEMPSLNALKFTRTYRSTSNLKQSRTVCIVRAEPPYRKVCVIQSSLRPGTGTPIPRSILMSLIVCSLVFRLITMIESARAFSLNSSVRSSVPSNRIFTTLSS